jgi:ribonuclease G
MRRELLINAGENETRVAILEDGRLVELMHEHAEAGRIVGDMYLGRVDAVLPGIQAAFIDIGYEKAGFLHASDAADPAEDDDDDGGGSGGGRHARRYPPIQEVVKKGQEILVQVTKEPIGTKGPRVTTQVSLPGRFIVYIPSSTHVGVSRKIDDREERSRLRAMARGHLGNGKGGVIIRTVGEELTEDAFKRELKTLQKTWSKVQNRVRSMKAPAMVHSEAKLTSGIIRDLFSEKVDSLIIDDPELEHEVRSYLGQVSPELLDRVKKFDKPGLIFDEYGVEEEIERAFRRKVNLKSGGHVVIESTEALVTIDVNTGRYTGKKDPAKTILKTNMEAAAEVARQLRLRDIGGIIVIDFIDMDEATDRDKVIKEMKSHLGRDRARTKVFGISELGLLQMSRQRVVRRVERAIRRAALAKERRSITLRVHPEVALYLLEEEPQLLRSLASETGIDLDIRDDPLMGAEEFRLLAAPADTDVTGKYAA